MVDLLTGFPDAARTGVQSIGRALVLLRLVSESNFEGARLVDVVAASGLAKPTVHRLLSEMCAGGLLLRQERRYHLGPFAYELGIVASSKFPERDICLPVLQELAGVAGGTVYLVTRSGPDALCLEVHSRVNAPWIRRYGRGRRTPLGAGASALALLSYLPDAERDALVAQNDTRVLKANRAAPDLASKVAQTRANGFAFTDSDVVREVSAIGIPVLDRLGRPIVAISVADASNRMSSAHRKDVMDALYEQAGHLRESLLAAQVVSPA